MWSIKLALTAALLAFASNTQAQDQRRCGGKIAPCPEDTKCVPDDPDCTDPSRCFGNCEFKNEYKPCGVRGLDPPHCDDSEECVDDPRLPDSCGMACDIPGICIPTDPPACAGFAGFECPEGLYCYDKPDDGCDPENGGADCIGICL